MDMDKIIEILETDTISYSFSDKGLKYLSLKNNKGESTIDLRSFKIDKKNDPIGSLIIEETIKFLQTGSHNMRLDLSSFTEFQQKVFQIVSNIPVKSIYTYKEVGISMGNPHAAQAVGNAVSKNPVSYFLPTHRVLSQKGIPICKSGAGHIREKLLIHEGHNIEKIRGNYPCKAKKCHEK